MTGDLNAVNQKALDTFYGAKIQFYTDTIEEEAKTRSVTEDTTYLNNICFHRAFF